MYKLDIEQMRAEYKVLRVNALKQLNNTLNNSGKNGQILSIDASDNDLYEYVKDEHKDKFFMYSRILDFADGYTPKNMSIISKGIKSKYIKESITDYKKEFKRIYKVIKAYIDVTLSTDVKINNFVPNTHIAMVFKEVLGACEKESMYPEIYHNLKNKNGFSSVVDPSKFDLIDGLYYSKETNRISFIDEINAYFDLDRLEKDGINEIHRAYQMLRRKEDYIRQALKLIDIRVPDEYNMNHKVRKDLITDRIKIKAYE